MNLESELIIGHVLCFLICKMPSLPHRSVKYVIKHIKFQHLETPWCLSTFKAFNPVLFNMKAQIQATHVIKKFQVAPLKKVKKEKKNILSFNKTEVLN